MKTGLDGDTESMKKAILFLKKHMAALCACMLACIMILSAVWLRDSGVRRAFSGKRGNVQAENLKNGGEEEKSFHPPAMGNAIVPYSAQELMYNPTTRVYEIHEGTDFLCPDGRVYCVLDGRVEDVSFDPLWGNMVVVRHEDDGASVYASLEEALVRKGSYVKAGDIIGKSGDSAAIERETGAHLHFEYRKNGKSQPISFTTAPET